MALLLEVLKKFMVLKTLNYILKNALIYNIKTKVYFMVIFELIYVKIKNIELSLKFVKI